MKNVWMTSGSLFKNRKFQIFITLTLTVILISACTPTIPEPTPTPIPTSTSTPIPTATTAPTSTATLTSTQKPTATNTIESSPTPQKYPQINLGLPQSAINEHGCGGTAYITQDHDPAEGTAKSYWDAYPDFPKPEFKYRTKDGRRALDYCTKEGYPVTFEQEEGRVTQNREDGVLDVLITKGIGKGLTITHGHVNPDLNPLLPGDQMLEIGTAVY